jgi:hypothetical protein
LQPQDKADTQTQGEALRHGVAGDTPARGNERAGRVRATAQLLAA